MGEDWVSITEAAARLATLGDPLDRSTLSRYLAQHAEALPVRVEGKAKLIEFGALRAHRGENIRIRAPLPQVPAAPAPAIQARRFAGSQADGAARKANADAELREMDLAQRRKQLTPTAEVDQAGRDAVALMQSAFDRAIESEAMQIALRYGWEERQIRLALKAFARRGIEVFHREVLERLDAMRRADDAGEPVGTADAAAPLQ